MNYILACQICPLILNVREHNVVITVTKMLFYWTSESIDPMLQTILSELNTILENKNYNIRVCGGGDCTDWPTGTVQIVPRLSPQSPNFHWLLSSKNQRELNHTIFCTILLWVNILFLLWHRYAVKFYSRITEQNGWQT